MALNIKIKEKTEWRDSGRPLVLIVDDEVAICNALSSVLEDESFSTISAHDGTEALSKVEQYQPDLVFLDIWMPGWDGVETLERIKAISPRTEVVMMSGHATISNALEATKRGAFDFIEKPLDIDSIILSTNRALERRHLRVVENFRSKKSPAQEPGDFVSPGYNQTISLKDENERLPLLWHPGVVSTTLRGKNLGQRTLKKSAILYGHCLHSGQKSGLVLEPLPLNSGIHFAKIGNSKTVPALVTNVESTGFATTIRNGPAVAATIEHLMAALHAYRITNLLIKCNGEVPIFDGSSLEFCNCIEEMGVEEQGGDWFEILVDHPLEVWTERSAATEKGAKPSSCQSTSAQPQELISIEPSERFSVAYELDYPSPVGRQYFEFVLGSPEDFKQEIAPARTFGFMKDVEHLQKAGLAAGGRLDNFILIGQDKVVNTRLRFPDELVRHKILDIIGDLYLLGRPLCGKVTARMTGHSDNVRLLIGVGGRVLGQEEEEVTTFQNF